MAISINNDSSFLFWSFKKMNEVEKNQLNLIDGGSLPYCPEEIELLLLESKILEGGLVQQGSNYTFIVELQSKTFNFWGIYKPFKGERPLWDFPYGTLHYRERCSYIISDFLGWNIVPPTVIRGGPHGEGSMQFCVHYDGESNYYTLRDSYKERMILIACFDLLVNNRDRKPGHCFRSTDGKIWGIDHGLTFHVEPKLRSVIWDFCGHELCPKRLNDIGRLAAELEEEKTKLSEELLELLEEDEFEIFRKRVAGFIKNPKLPTVEEYLKQNNLSE
ncbi:MAG: SCO1664 family protein [Nitrospinota bacterium]|nr:SCO1664 family protein [Nitrospinota bacterium]